MDGAWQADPPHATTPNGSTNGVHVAQVHLSQVLEALHSIYDPASSNTTRRQATQYLESAKHHPDAPAHGRNLALDRSQPAQLRHYGLTMLEHAILYNWEDFTVAQGEALRDCVVELAQSITEDDPVYLRNKVAHLWVEVAKRSWGDEWLNMDEQLVALWQTSLHHQAVVLYVLETLSEEVFNREDATAGLRGSDLGRACVEIFTPAEVLTQQLPTRDKGLAVRFGDEGWLRRLCDNLNWCLSQDFRNEERVRTCAVKTMNALRASMSWIMPKAISALQIIQNVSRVLAAPVVDLQLAAIEVIQAIYLRHHLHDEDIVELVSPMLTVDSVNLLREVYNWTLSDMDAHDIHEQKYMLCKKIAEIGNSLGLFVEQKLRDLPEGSNIPGFLELLFDITRNPSLFVSIPVLHCWTKLLRSRFLRENFAQQIMMPLLELCCARLIRYEAFPEDSENPTILFLNEDVDTVPERHAFLGNYRRYCVDIIETAVRHHPIDAMTLVLTQATTMFQNLYQDEPPFQPQTFSKSSMPVLRVDAHVTIIDAALKGYLKWLSMPPSADPEEFEDIRVRMEESFEQWCSQLIQARFEDPEITKKVVQLMSTFSTKALPDRPHFALSFLEYLLTVKLADNPSLLPYSESVKDLDRMCSLEMQKLAMKFPDDFMNVYDTLEQKIKELVASPESDERQRLAFNAFLFIIIHRCTTLDRDTKANRMRQILGQVNAAWQSEELTKSISNFQSFCAMLGMEHLPEFFSTHNFEDVQDWSDQPLPSEGQALQAAILERSNHLPLRLTKTLLAASIEKLRDGSPAYEIAASLWADAIPVVLPNILQLVSHAQAFNNVEASWAHLPPDLQQVIRRVLTDRFWQAGISTESREDFFARVSSSKSTYEGFASTVRGTVRQIRESSYFILYSLTRFPDSFYSISDLPEHFLPPMIEGLFGELNRKISSEWDAVNRQVAQAGDNDNLTDEMKTESILRQLTYSSVSLVASLLDFRQGITDNTQQDHQAQSPSMPTFILSHLSVLSPILLFSNSTLRVRDTRSVLTTIRVLRSLIPRFREASPIRSFFCDDVLKNAITSLHEPYFVDCQKELASLIAAIILLEEETPRNILLSLPGVGSDPARLDRRLAKLRSANRSDERLQRSIVLDLLASLRGVSIHELGKVERGRGIGGGGGARNRGKVMEQYMQMSVETQPGIVRGGSPGLEGVAGMFGGE
ncbi:uncharacterized protein EI97DRAFT_374586 [Westerdykella ornata]|uniref:Importin N-terminal domain-containing protein n=1 Tax=Westerdykella ornata TaxID=318751 RepID=A0A6A6JRH8_WESOR|nr:uncharacterized protein EI97DRAFT_374586 [Westerdykella ornata]KAF2277539.1 hypothetical protein EI97DRAFT_374586 [Westerdykella ornata]